MIVRVLSWCLALAGLALLSLAIASYFAPPAGPGLTTPERDIEARDRVAGQRSDMAVRLHNDTGHPLRIIGVEEC